MSLTPTSELEAVNMMLSVIGESPVNSLENSGVTDANIAHQILQHASRECQLVGWHWNTEKDFPIRPNADKHLVLPYNTLKVDTSGASADIDLVQRGNRLYDRVNHTYKADKTVYVELVLNLAFDEIPEAARSYIAIRAARQFQERVLGSTALQAFNSQDEYRAMATLRDAEADIADHNILTGNWSVSRVLARNR